MKLLISLYLAILNANVYATEIRFASVDCKQKTPLQSRIITTFQSPDNTIFTVKVVGGYPAFYGSFADPHFTPCIDSDFNRANFNKESQSIEGYALYSEPYLYVFVPGREDAYIGGVYEAHDQLYDTIISLKFSVMNGSYTLLHGNSIGSFQGAGRSSGMPYNLTSPSIVYKDIDNL